MRRALRRLNLLLALWLPAFAAHAGVQLTVTGVDDPLKAAVTAGVELSQYASREVSAAQIRRPVERAPAQAQTALQSYGYYDASVSSTLVQAGRNWRVTLQVRSGEPVKITAVELQLDPQAAALAPIRRARRTLEKLRGQTLNDGT